MSDLPAPLVTALADRYRIERELGQGGMATVYLAEDLKHRRQVAIKVLRPEVASAVGPARFLREIETAAGLSHPHILPLYDSGEAGGCLYYVMPFVAGESLRDRLRREAQLPVDDALRIAREVADALSYAHSRGVVHRDIKPENILLESGHAVVADFGIARAVAAAGDATVTGTGVVLGTPAYMSPEQAAGGGDVDGRSDLYSLGCVLYEMLAGQPPFTGATLASLTHQHLTVVPRQVTELRPAVPGWVAVAVQRALSKAPADRFSPVTLFAEALAHREPASPAASAPVAPAQLRRPWRRFAGLAAAAVVVGLGVGAFLLLRPDHKAAPAHRRTEIAVLPFENLSGEGPNAYFAGGLQDELLTQLSKVAALKVISRTSVMGYQGTTRPLRQIADELGVGSVVEGSVQVVGARLRVNVQLIDATSDNHLWAESYDRTLDDAFAIQSEVAQRIVAAVGAALTGDEQGRLAAAPTANAEAYRLYLQGLEYWHRPGFYHEDIEAAQRLFERAVDLDPGFALAHAFLSRTHGLLVWQKYDLSPARAARQEAEAEIALRLAPDLPEAHIAMGLNYYWGHREYRKALDEFAIAQRGQPNEYLWRAIGYVNRRLGNWDETFAAFEKAAQLDPLTANTPVDLGDTYEIVHRPADSIREYEKALRIAPNLQIAAVFRGWTYARWQGQLDTLRTALDRLPRDAALGDLGNAAAQRAALLLWERNPDALLQELQRARVDVYEGQPFYLPSALYAAWAHQLRGDRASARAAFDSALAVADAALKALPGDERVRYARGMALAGLGRMDEARAEATWLQQSEVYRGDAFTGRIVAEDRARVLAQIGDAGPALTEIERLLSGPSFLTVASLRLDPLWDPLRGDPRFQALLVKYATPEAR